MSTAVLVWFFDLFLCCLCLSSCQEVSGEEAEEGDVIFEATDQEERHGHY